MSEKQKIKKAVLGYINSLSKEKLDEYYDKHRQSDDDDIYAHKISGYIERQNYENCFDMMNVLRNAICYNQGRLVQFMFSAAEKHKDLRIYCDAFEKDCGDFHVLKNKLLGLRSYIDESLVKNINRNIDYLYQYFYGRSDSAPRICLKGKSSINGQNQIVRVFSDESISYNSSVDISRSTAYQYIQSFGKYYIENDIPKAVTEGRYKNSRLSDSKLSSFLRDGVDLSDVWPSCWNDAGLADGSSYYKSTLIIPVTLKNNKLDFDFVEKFNSKIYKGLGETDLNPGQIERTIFAFLCLDHVDEWYFEEEYDVKIGYVIADMISFYLFLRAMYIEVSDVFSRAREILRQAGIPLQVEKHVFSSARDRGVDRSVLGEEECETTSNNVIATLLQFDSCF